MKCLLKCFGFCFSVNIEKDKEEQINRKINSPANSNSEAVKDKIEIQINDEKIEGLKEDVKRPPTPFPHLSPPVKQEMNENEPTTILVKSKLSIPEDNEVISKPPTPSSEPCSDDDIENVKKLENHFSDCDEYEYV